MISEAKMLSVFGWICFGLMFIGFAFGLGGAVFDTHSFNLGSSLAGKFALFLCAIGMVGGFIVLRLISLLENENKEKSDKETSPNQEPETKS